jgi:four helix bundle protein
MRDHTKLRVWSMSRQLALEIYRATGGFPATERYGLAAQLRRAAVSVGSNITEGAARSSRSEYARFLDIAKSSASECAYQILLARDLGFISETDYARMHGLAVGLRQKLEALRTRVLEERDPPGV